MLVVFFMCVGVWVGTYVKCITYMNECVSYVCGFCAWVRYMYNSYHLCQVYHLYELGASLIYVCQLHKSNVPLMWESLVHGLHVWVMYVDQMCHKLWCVWCMVYRCVGYVVCGLRTWVRCVFIQVHYVCQVSVFIIYSLP